MYLIGNIISTRQKNGNLTHITRETRSEKLAGSESKSKYAIALEKHMVFAHSENNFLYTTFMSTYVEVQKYHASKP